MSEGSGPLALLRRTARHRGRARGVGPVGISPLVGLAAGSLAGFLGGAADRIFTGACDVLLAFPGILLAIGIAAVRGPSFGNVLFSLSVLGGVGYDRGIRAQVLSLTTRE